MFPEESVLPNHIPPQEGHTKRGAGQLENAVHEVLPPLRKSQHDEGSEKCQIDRFNTFWGNKTYSHAVDSGGGAHTWENIVLPLLQVKILFLAHTLLVQGACLREAMLLL